MKNYAHCEKCGEYKRKTKHHVYPKTYFGRKGKKLILCRDCHDEIEELIPKFQKMSKAWYDMVNNSWLNGELQLGG